MWMHVVRRQPLGGPGGQPTSRPSSVYPRSPWNLHRIEASPDTCASTSSHSSDVSSLITRHDSTKRLGACASRLGTCPSTLSKPRDVGPSRPTSTLSFRVSDPGPPDGGTRPCTPPAHATVRIPEDVEPSETPGLLEEALFSLAGTTSRRHADTRVGRSPRSILRSPSA